MFFMQAPPFVYWINPDGGYSIDVIIDDIYSKAYGSSSPFKAKRPTADEVALRAAIDSRFINNGPLEEAQERRKPLVMIVNKIPFVLFSFIGPSGTPFFPDALFVDFT